MALGHVLLGLLAGGERHGYDLKRQHDARFPMAKPVAPAQVYATLERLLRDGLIAPGATERAGGPDRTAYAVTPAGKATARNGGMPRFRGWAGAAPSRRCTARRRP